MVNGRNAQNFGGDSGAADDTVIPAFTVGTNSVHSKPLSGTGTIYSFTIMYNVPQGYEEQKPYAIAIIQLDEGPMITAQLTDMNHNEIAIGQRVEMVTRKLREEGNEGQIIYGYKFRPSL